MISCGRQAAGSNAWFAADRTAAGEAGQAEGEDMSARMLGGWF